MTFNIEKSHINLISAIGVVFAVGALIWAVSDFKHSIERSLAELQTTVKAVQIMQGQIKQTIWTRRDMSEWCLAAELTNPNFRCPPGVYGHRLRKRAGKAQQVK